MTETEKRIAEIKEAYDTNIAINIENEDIVMLLDQHEKYKKALDKCKEQRDKYLNDIHTLVSNFNLTIDPSKKESINNEDKEIEKILNPKVQT